MTWSANELCVLVSALPLMAAVAYADLRNMRIPNTYSLLGLALFAMSLPLLGFDEWIFRAAVGGVAFALCFVLFAVGWFGGGDAKILPVTVLFVPASFLEAFLVSFAFAMLAGMLGVWCARKKYAHPEAKWVSMKPNAAFPMGISIAASLPLTALTVSVLMNGGQVF